MTPTYDPGVTPRPNRVRAARQAAGLSQAAVAQAAGVSRQTIGTIESGRHRPSVDAALAIARAIGCSVEDLFGGPPATTLPVFGELLPNGSPILAARVGDTVAYASAADALAFTGWPQANAIIDAGSARPLPDADLDGLLIVGCDPALGTLATLLPPNGPKHLIAISGSSGRAITAMAAGRAHGALVHGPIGRLPMPPRGALCLHLASWRVGLAARDRPTELTDLARPGVQVVQRDAGASSQKAFLAAIEKESIPTVDGPIASGHVDAARRVAEGAVAAVTMEPAALQYKLAFRVLEDHTADIWIDPRWREHPGVEALANTINSAAFATRMQLIGGYDFAAV